MPISTWSLIVSTAMVDVKKTVEPRRKTPSTALPYLLLGEALIPTAFSRYSVFYTFAWLHLNRNKSETHFIAHKLRSNSPNLHTFIAFTLRNPWSCLIGVGFFGRICFKEIELNPLNMKRVWQKAKFVHGKHVNGQKKIDFNKCQEIKAEKKWRKK